MNNPGSADFERLSRPVSDRLIKQLQALIPRTWPVAMLQLDVTLSAATGARSIKHRLWNPVSDAEFRDFPEEFFQTTTELHSIFSEYGQPWVRSLTFYQTSPKGGIQIETHYRYR
jgi:hypothetical protein